MATMVAGYEKDGQDDAAEETPPQSTSITLSNQELPSRSTPSQLPTPAATPNAANGGQPQPQKRKQGTDSSISLRKRVALKSATNARQHVSKKPSSALRGLTTELGETNKVLKNLRENSSPISMAVTLLGKDLPKIPFVHKMKVIQKLREPDMADIYTHLLLKERKMLVKSMLDDLGIDLDDAMGGESDSNESSNSDIEIVNMDAEDD